MRRATFLVSMAASAYGPAVLVGSCGTGGRLSPPAGDSAVPLARPSAPVKAEPGAPEAPSPSAAGGEDSLDAGGLDAGEPDCSGRESEGAVELPRLTFGVMTNATADASVDMSYGELQGPIERSHRRLLCCYDVARGRRPDLEGTLLLDFTLNADGSVKASSVDPNRSDIKDPAMGACVSTVLSTLSFPPSRRGRGATVSMPIAFRPRSPGARPDAAR